MSNVYYCVLFSRETGMAMPKPKDEDREGLYTLREFHVRGLHRLFDEIHDGECFKSLTDSQLRVRKTRTQQHFSDMEKAHVQYCRAFNIAAHVFYEDLLRIDSRS